MIENGIRLVCDICGKKSKWIKKPDTPTLPEAPQELNNWKTFDLKGPEWIDGRKDYCSKECVIKDLNSIYNEK